MPLLHIIGLSPSNSSFSIAFCFMQNEQEESYKWTLQTFFSWLNPLPFPPVLCTDRDLALLGAIKAIYPKSPHLLCVWHINKNVLAKTKQYFSSNEEFEAFILSWKSLINSSSVIEY
jgi:histone-lysine N-methyltransferase SETD2